MNGNAVEKMKVSYELHVQSKDRWNIERIYKGHQKKDVIEGQLVQTYGFVLGIHSQAHPKITFIYTTTPFGPGFSGGPVVNSSNQVVGIATVEGRSINLALPINPVKEFLHQKTTFSFQKLLNEDQASLEAMYYRGNYFLYGLGEPDKAIAELEEVKDGNDKDAIESKSKALEEIAGQLAQQAAAQAQAEAGEQAGAQSESAKSTDDVVDAEFEEVKDEDK